MTQKRVSDSTELNISIFRERFIKLREEHKMSQAQFAVFLGIPSGSVGGYENGTKFPNGKTLFTIATKCEVSADYLLGLQDNPVLKEDLKMICNYTGLSKEAVKRLHWITNRINGKEITEIISSLIVPDENARFMNDLTFISGALYCYGKGYTELIEKMRSIYSSLNDLPIEKVREISVSFEKERKQTKTDYYDVFELFKKLVDDYIKTHINTPEKYAVYKDFWQAISNREEETQ